MAQQNPPQVLAPHDAAGAGMQPCGRNSLQIPVEAARLYHPAMLPRFATAAATTAAAAAAGVGSSGQPCSWAALLMGH